MEPMEILFREIPDTVFITDPCGYLLDLNRAEPFRELRKGQKLTSLIPDCFSGEEGEVRWGDQVYQRQTTPIRTQNALVGYTVLLTDITAETRLAEELQSRSRELGQLAEELTRSNAALEAYAMQAKELSDYAEQLRIARVIHDDYGHAITELHVLSQMCLQLLDRDAARVYELLAQGKEICRRARREGRQRDYASLSDLLDCLRRISQFPVEVSITGTEPAFLRPLYGTIEHLCREAYHNTLDHSLADRFWICAELGEEVVIRIWDNGSFHGTFEKGFGLSAVEDQIRASGGSVEMIAREGEGFEILARWRDETWRDP